MIVQLSYQSTINDLLESNTNDHASHSNAVHQFHSTKNPINEVVNRGI